MDNDTSLGFGLMAAAITLAATIYHWWRYNRAREAVHEWLNRHHYRVRDLGVPWLGAMMHRPTLFRSSDNAFNFRAVIDDRELGGTGAVQLRVWVNSMGDVYRDIEVVWERMPTADSELADSFPAPPLAERLMDAQLGVLRRISEGEKSFSLPRRAEFNGSEFDQLVEHALALSRRGLITCREPESGARYGTQYSFISDLALTPDGKVFLAEQQGTREGSQKQQRRAEI